MSRQFKIAVIGLKGLPSTGGGASIMQEVLTELKDQYKFCIFSSSNYTLQETYNGIPQIIFNGISHQGLNFFLYYLKSCFYCLFKKKFDLIHVHHLAGAFIVPLLRIKYKNVIVTSHGMPDKTDKWKSISWLYYPIMRFFFARYSSCITTVTGLHSSYFSRYTKKQIITIPNGIRVISNTNSNITLPEGYLLFAAGRIIEIKGLHLLIDALVKNKSKIPLYVVGDLSYNGSYKKLILQKCQGLNVQFIPLIKDKDLLLTYIKKAKLFIFPSTVEAMSMMLLEAASMKTPIIASNIDENKSVFSDEEVLFFESENIEDLADKIDYALINFDKMKLKSENAFSRVERDYNIATIAKQYSELYKAIK